MRYKYDSTLVHQSRENGRKLEFYENSISEDYAVYYLEELIKEMGLSIPSLSKIMRQNELSVSPLLEINEIKRKFYFEYLKENLKKSGGDESAGKIGLMDKQPHIQLDESAGVTKAIIVGDPARVDKFRPFLANPQELAYNREFKSLRGNYKGEPILVLSTGVGAPSAAIAVEELYNIGVRRIIRAGSAGAMRKGIGLGELIIGIGAVRDDGLSRKYVDIEFPAVPSPRLLAKAMSLAPNAVYGVIRSHDGFYMDDNEQTEAHWSAKGVVGADMESGILFTLGLLRGIETLSVLNNVVLYQEDLSEGVNALVGGDDKVEQGERASIELVLKLIV